jgi:hypothetical protein
MVETMAALEMAAAMVDLMAAADLEMAALPAAALEVGQAAAKPLGIRSCLWKPEPNPLAEIASGPLAMHLG